MLSWWYSTAFPCFSALHVYHWWCSLDTMFNIKHVLLFHDSSSPSWISGDFSQFEIPLNDFRRLTSAPLCQTNLRPDYKRRGWGSKGWVKGVRAVLRLVGGCCSVPFVLNQRWLLLWWEMEQTGFKEGRLPVAWSHVTNLDQLIYRPNDRLNPLPCWYSWARVCVWGTISPSNPGPAPIFVALRAICVETLAFHLCTPPCKVLFADWLREMSWNNKDIPGPDHALLLQLILE